MSVSPQVSKWKAYPAYKDSGVEWLGKVPATWKVKRLKFNSYMKGRIGWQNLRSDEFTEHGPYLITGMHFANGSVDWDGCYHISKERYEMAPEIQIKSHDLLITKDGSIGKLAYIEQLPGPASLNSHLLVLRPLHTAYLSRYLYYLLSSFVFETYSEMYQTGTTFSGITQETVGNFSMLVPTLSEQAAIASFLDRQTTKIDALLTKREQLIALLQEKRTALITHAVTKGLDAAVPMKVSGVEWFGKIPVQWKVKRLKFSVSFYGGGTPSKANLSYWNGDIPWVSPKDMVKEVISDSEDHVTNDAIASSATQIIKPGAVLIVVRSGILKRAIPIAINTCAVTLNQDMKALVPKTFLTSKYLQYLLIGHQDALLFQWRKAGSTVESIEQDLLSNTHYPLPPVSEQHAINAFLDNETAKLDSLIDKVREGIEKLKEYRIALISAAVTGKIDVRGV